MLTLTECKTAKEFRVFENVAEDLLSGDAAFVPPFPGSVGKFLTPKSAFHQRYGTITPIVALRDGRPVGRIAAIVNRAHNEYSKDETGFFGFFECENNQETADALIRRASEILKAAGLASIRGPYSPSINDECGLLVNRHDVPPFIGLTWNPSYYQRLLEGSGFQVVRRILGYHLPLHRLERPERLIRITERVAKKSKLRLRPIRLKELEKEMEIVREVYNDTLERNWGFVPITMEDLLGAADDMKAIADPEMILIAEQDGERAGIALSLPNFNEILHAAKRTPRWLRILHIALLMKTRRIREVRQIVYGVSPRFRDRGLHGWLLLEHFSIAKARYHAAELGWIEENNSEVIAHVEFLGAFRDKEWCIFEKPL